MTFALPRVLKSRAPKKSAKTLAALALVAGSAFSATISSTPAEAYTTTGQFRPYGNSQYHVYANGIDWSQPVGVVFYLDGDYWTTNQSKIWFPSTNRDLINMAKVANERNMLFVPVITPSARTQWNGYTWWENVDYNGDWFRNFANWFNSSAGVDRSKVWTIGYSGGAEFETMELGADRQTSWRSGGGSIMVGGGSPRTMQTYPNAEAKAMSYQWYVGKNDGRGITNPPTWSAFEASENGWEYYQSIGYRNNSREVLPGIDHYQYNFPDILARAFNKAGVKVRPVVPTLKGAIGEYYRAHGGEGTFGTPTTQEFGLIDGGVGQQFSKNYTIYWREGLGAHSVKFTGAIGALYRAGDFERGHGFPISDETATSNGGAYQKFQRANGTRYTYYWHPSTGAHILYENGEIGYQFNQHRGTSGWGYPVAEEQGFSNDGAKQVFYQPGNDMRTAVYWSQETGAHGINERGAIHNTWTQGGGVNGYGYPVTDETVQKDGTVTVKFSKGKTLSWSPVTGKVSELS